MSAFFLSSLSLSFTDLFLSLSRRAERKRKLISAVGKLNPEESSPPPLSVYPQARLRWMRSAIFAWDHVCRKTCSQTTALLSASFRPFSRSSSLARLSFVNVQEIPPTQHPFNKQQGTKLGFFFLLLLLFGYKELYIQDTCEGGGRPLIESIQHHTHTSS